MKIDRILSKIFVMIFLSAVTSFPLSAQTNKFQISFSGNWNHLFSYGSESDYSMGTNDFPVTPGHGAFQIGGSFMWMIQSRLGIGLTGRYSFPASLNLTDPSDGDQAEIDSAAHWSLILNGTYFFLEGPVRPFIRIGGGVDKLSAEEKTVQTDYGFQAFFTVPEDTWDWIASGEAGVEFEVADRWGAVFKLGYSRIFSRPDNIQSLSGSAGIIFKF